MEGAASVAAGAAIAALSSQAAFAAERETACGLFGIDGDGPIMSQHVPDAAGVLAKLTGIFEEDVRRILAVVMAETLVSGTELIDTRDGQMAVDVDWR